VIIELILIWAIEPQNYTIRRVRTATECRTERARIVAERGKPPLASYCLERLKTGGLLPIAIEWTSPENVEKELTK